MGRSIIALILVLDVLVCPFACSGTISLGSETSCDPCCSPKQTDPGDESPLPADDGCDGSCEGCLCGGAVNGEETCASFVLAQDTLTHVGSPVVPVTVSATSTASSRQILSDDTPVFPFGVELRALLQSFLL